MMMMMYVERKFYILNREKFSVAFQGAGEDREGVDYDEEDGSDDDYDEEDDGENGEEDEGESI